VIGKENHEIEVPKEPIDRFTGPLERFMHIEAAGGVVLLGATIVALWLANSGFSADYLGIWKTKLTLGFGSFEMSHSLKHWINDGLMVIFFFTIGMEVKRELVIGELREVRRAALPVAAALGGMVVPAVIYLGLQLGQPAERGWGIPMATDIAFVVGCLSVLGSRVPLSLRILLLSLAIADDIGAILVIAIGYTDNLNFIALACSLLGLVGVAVLARLGVRSFGVYILAGVAIWFGFHESGVHATIAGVILGLMTPAHSYLSTGFFGRVLNRASAVLQGEWENLSHRAERVRRFRNAAREMVSPVEYLESVLHPWVGFVIMPLFALANAGVPIHTEAFADPVVSAVLAGLVIGKPLGILLFSWIALRLGIATLPADLSWGMLAGGGCLAGIGFTMAMFIAGLALDGGTLDAAKIGVLAASVLAALLGMVILIFLLPKDARR